MLIFFFYGVKCRPIESAMFFIFLICIILFAIYYRLADMFDVIYVRFTVVYVRVAVFFK